MNSPSSLFRPSLLCGAFLLYLAPLNAGDVIVKGAGSSRGSKAVVVGGKQNKTTKTAAGVLAGQKNQAKGARGGIVAGFQNQVTGSNGAVAGGQSNRASGTRSGSLAGFSNTAGGADAVTLGGRANAVNGSSSLAHGCYLSDAGLAGNILFSDSDPTGERAGGGGFSPGTKDQFNAQFLGGFSFMVDPLGETNGLVIVPSDYPDNYDDVTGASNGANPAGGSGNSPVFVGINTGMPVDGGGATIDPLVAGPQAPLHVHSTSELTADGYAETGVARFGDYNGFNLGIDGVELQAYNGSTPSTLYINDFGGAVNIATDAGAVSPINIGNIAATGPVNIHGTVNIGASGTGTTVTIGTTGTTTVNGTFVNASDRNIKEDVSPVNQQEILDRLVELPVQSWRYIGADSRRHVGPMAQDFHAAFDDTLSLHSNDKTIAQLDVGGVTIAAIQALNEKVEKKDAEIATLRERLEKLENLILIGSQNDAETGE